MPTANSVVRHYHHHRHTIVRRHSDGLPLAKRPRRCAVPESLTDLGVKLVVFDMAGTVVDEGGIVYSTLKETMRKYGLTVDNAEFDKWHGANKKEVIAYFVEQEKKGNTDKIYASFEKALEVKYFCADSPLKIIPGAVELFDKLQAAGIKVGLDTGFPRKIADHIIKKLDFGPHIDGSCVAMEVGKGRPFPYMIYNLMRQFGIERVDQVVKVGDTARDMEEGRFAGTPHVFGVLSGADDRATLVKHGASVVLNSVAEMVV